MPAYPSKGQIVNNPDYSSQQVECHVTNKFHIHYRYSKMVSDKSDYQHKTGNTQFRKFMRVKLD